MKAVNEKIGGWQLGFSRVRAGLKCSRGVRAVSKVCGVLVDVCISE